MIRDSGLKLRRNIDIKDKFNFSEKGVIWTTIRS